MAQAGVSHEYWSNVDPRFETFNRLLTTKAAIGQTPKEVVWTLNKTKLYRYIPVVPAEARHPIPLFLVFALMNRPTILGAPPHWI
jgi:polyhydroxyalkanoate synthase